MPLFSSSLLCVSGHHTIPGVLSDCALLVKVKGPSLTVDVGAVRKKNVHECVEGVIPV